MRHILIATVVALAATAARGQQKSPFPEGAGRDIVVTACTQCHAPAPIVQLRMGEAGWRHEVENMVLRGAQIRPSELDSVASYLAASFGPGVPFPDQAAPKVQLAAGSGADMVAAGCGLCHGLDRAVGTLRPAGQWPAIVHRMVEIGAPLDEDQAKQIVAYLQANYANPAR